MFLRAPQKYHGGARLGPGIAQTQLSTIGWTSVRVVGIFYALTIGRIHCSRASRRLAEASESWPLPRSVRVPS
jgi:hypothetical protein